MKNTRGLTLAASLALALILVGVGFAAGLSAKQRSLETERVVLDNARVRVLEYTSKPHGNVCGVGTHSHPAHVTIVLSPARDRATAVGGKPEVADMKVGDVIPDFGTDVATVIMQMPPRPLVPPAAEPTAQPAP